MKRPIRPIFLARASYKRRRLYDAAVLLPVLGAVLLILPMLWTPKAQGLRPMSYDIGYFFSIWAGLILVAAGFASGLSRRPHPREKTEEEG